MSNHDGKWIQSRHDRDMMILEKTGEVRELAEALFDADRAVCNNPDRLAEFADTLEGDLHRHVYYAGARRLMEAGYRKVSS